MKNLIRVVMVLSAILSASAGSAAEMKNVIIMIADGWGYNQILATNYWQGVAAQSYQQFPVSLWMSTYSWDTQQGDPLGYDPDQAWSDFDYPLWRYTDSASAATAMSTGVKNRDAQIAIDPVTGQPLFHALQRAELLGKATGVITSVAWSHATPAGFVAHDDNRNHYQQLAIEMIDSSGCEVIMGCGHPLYNSNGNATASTDYQYVGGVSKWNQLVAGMAGGVPPFTLIQTRADFQNLMTGPTPTRVCGTARVRNTLQQERTPAEGANSFTPPYTIPFISTVPTLVEMTRGALNVLDNDPDGLFLMIEGGAVDKASHANQMGRCIEEMADFNNAIAAVIAWIEANSNWNETLLIVTGDHETGYLWGPGSGYPATWNPIINNGPGQMPGAWYYSGGHSNSLIPIFAKGAGSNWLPSFATRLDPVRGPYMDNTDIARLVFGYYDGVLAVELASFAAVPGDGAVTLNWTTASESENDRFELERNGERIASVPAFSSPTGHAYSYTDRGLENGHGYHYALYAVDMRGNRDALAETEAIPSAGGARPESFALLPCYPNPFNPTTTIAFTLPETGFAELSVFDIQGRRVAMLVNERVTAGRHSATFNAARLSSGVYFCRLAANGKTAQQRLVLMK